MLNQKHLDYALDTIPASLPTCPWRQYRRHPIGASTYPRGRGRGQPWRLSSLSTGAASPWWRSLLYCVGYIVFLLIFFSKKKVSIFWWFSETQMTIKAVAYYKLAGQNPKPRSKSVKSSQCTAIKYFMTTTQKLVEKILNRFPQTRPFFIAQDS